MSCNCCQPIGEALVMCGHAHAITDASGRVWHFEVHNMFGPTVLTTRGVPRVRQPGVKSKFWDAFEFWEKNLQAKS